MRTSTIEIPHTASHSRLVKTVNQTALSEQPFDSDEKNEVQFDKEVSDELLQRTSNSARSYISWSKNVGGPMY